MEERIQDEKEMENNKNPPNPRGVGGKGGRISNTRYIKDLDIMPFVSEVLEAKDIARCSHKNSSALLTSVLNIKSKINDINDNIHCYVSTQTQEMMEEIDDLKDTLDHARTRIRELECNDDDVETLDDITPPVTKKAKTDDE